jgi:hypothetical protein
VLSGELFRLVIRRVNASIKFIGEIVLFFTRKTGGLAASQDFIISSYFPFNQMHDNRNRQGLEKQCKNKNPSSQNKLKNIR